MREKGSKRSYEWLDNDMLENRVALFFIEARHYKAKKGYYLNSMDLDNEAAIRKFCNIEGKQYTLEELAERGDIIIEQYTDDKTKAHMYVRSKEPDLIYRLLIAGAFKNQRRFRSNNDG